MKLVRCSLQTKGSFIVRRASPFHTTARFYRPFREGDVVLLKQADRPDTAPILTKPLKQDGRIESHRGNYKHADIIGKCVRDSVASTAGRMVRVHEPTLEEYTTLTPRLVTPVYSKEANLIISLLDLHPTPPPPRKNQKAHKEYEPLEILEAGTGHGALTLHLARAVHAANAHLHREHSVVEPSVEEIYAGTTTTPEDQPSSDSSRVPPTPETTNTPESPATSSTPPIKDPRGAIIHTIDISTPHSRHARKIVHAFRHGLYAPSIDFHVCTIPSFLADQARLRASRSPSSPSSIITPPTNPDPTEPAPPQPTPYLSHIVLDLPAPHSYLVPLSRALKTDGTLLVFCPSVTQILKCASTCKEQQAPLFLEKVVEVGPGMSGGRAWDVRFVRVRARERERVREKARGARGGESRATDAAASDGNEKDNSVSSPPPSSSDTCDIFTTPPPSADVNDVPPANGTSGQNAQDASTAISNPDAHDADDGGWEVVCRPKMGDRVTAGGFIGVWKKRNN